MTGDVERGPEGSGRGVSQDTYRRGITSVTSRPSLVPTGIPTKRKMKNIGEKTRDVALGLCQSLEGCIAASRLKPIPKKKRKGRLYLHLHAVNAIKSPPQDPAMMRLGNEKDKRKACSRSRGDRCGGIQRKSKKTKDARSLIPCRQRKPARCMHRMERNADGSSRSKHMLPRGKKNPKRVLRSQVACVCTTSRPCVTSQTGGPPEAKVG